MVKKEDEIFMIDVDVGESKLRASLCLTNIVDDIAKAMVNGMTNVTALQVGLLGERVMVSKSANMA